MPQTIDLATLSAARGFTIVAPLGAKNVGHSVSDAGDVNGDGFGDFIIGAPSISTYTYDYGRAYVVYGRAGGFGGELELLTLTDSEGFVIFGDAINDQAGYSVSSAGDINGDGFDDIIVGAPRGENEGNALFDAGEAYVIFGGPSHGAIDITVLNPTQGFVLRTGTSADQAGVSVSSAGDVNGDGLDDVIVGASFGDDGGNAAGEAYVVFGTANASGPVNLSTLTPQQGFIIQGHTNYNQAGVSVSSAGDINGDGFDDVIVGAPFGNGTSGAASGEAYIVFGTAVQHGTIDATLLNPDRGFFITGEVNGDAAGASVSSAGDVNGDGIDDLIVGAQGGDSGGLTAGQAYVVYGRMGGFGGRLNLADLSAAQGFAIQGDTAGDLTGNSVSAAGDVNGDGFDDVVIGAAFSDGGGYDSGVAYVVYGRAGRDARVDLSGLAAADGLIILGDRPSGNAGRSVSAAGDLNGDGFADILIGAPRTDASSTDSGEAYVVYGVAPTLSVTRTGSQIAQTIRGGIGDDTLDGRDGGDTLIGGGGNDVLIGGAGEDILSGGADDDDLNGGSGGDALVGGDGDDAAFGSAGDDDLTGDDGDDDLRGGSGNDSVNGGAGDDEVRGSSGNDTADGGTGDDLVAGNSGDDQLFGGEGSDHLIGGSGSDRLDGGLGGDTMAGGSGNDLYVVNSLGDRISEDDDAGRDRVNSFITFALGTSFVEDLTLLGAAAINGAGNSLANVITGNAAENTLNGGAGNDILVGGAGKDILTGGTGTDQFRFASGDTSAVQGLADRITDFNRTELDRIALDLIDAKIATGANDAFTFIGSAAFSGVAGQLRYTNSSTVTFVFGDTNGDSIADLVLRVDGVVAFVATDFAL